MALGMERIAGLMASTGANIGSQMTGLGALGNRLGNILADAPGDIRQKQMQQEANAFLQANKNNPQALAAKATEYATAGNDYLAKAFQKASEVAGARAYAAETDPVKRGRMRAAMGASSGSLEEVAAGTQDIQNAYIARGKKGMERLKAALAQAPDLKTAENIERNLDSIAASIGEPTGYFGTTARKIKEAAPKQEDLKFETKEVLVDGTETLVQFATDKKTGELVKTTPLGVTKDNVKQEFQGLDFNLDTLEGLRNARKHAITVKQNASLANTLTGMIEEKTPQSLTQSMSMMRDISPTFVAAEEDLEIIERFQTLKELSQDDIAGLSALIERTLTATTENDLKAVAELERFRGAKDIPQKLKDWALMTASGRLSQETMNEYGVIADALQELSNRRLLNSIDSVIINGSSKESQGAVNLRNMYSADQARILP